MISSCSRHCDLLSNIDSNESLTIHSASMENSSCRFLPAEMYESILLFLHPRELCVVTLVSIKLNRIADLCWKHLSVRPTCNYVTFLSKSAISLPRRVSYAYGSSGSGSPSGIVVMNTFNTISQVPVKLTGTPHACSAEHIINRLPGYVDSRGGCVLSTSASDILLVGGYDHSRAGAVRDILCFNACSGVHYRLEQDLPEAVCFSSCTRMIDGAVVATGGGDSPYQHGDISRSCLLFKAGLKYNEQYSEQRYEVDIVSLPDMLTPRSVHGCVTLLDGRVVVVGGYSGGNEYSRHVEIYDATVERWSYLPELRVGRSGIACAVGMYGCIYVAGGSSNGMQGCATFEMLDPREKQWQLLPSCITNRGYSAGCMGMEGCFYVSGGFSLYAPRDSSAGIEYFDHRAGRWDTCITTVKGQHVVADWDRRMGHLMINTSL